MLDGMKAAILTAKRTLTIGDWPDDELRPGMALVRVCACGICGSDVHYWQDGRIGDTRVTYPYVNGHEPAGIVERTAPDVLNVRPGDRVIIEPAVSCGVCRACLAGRQNACRDVRFLASPPVVGAFRERIAIDARNLFAMPEAMDMKTAALMEPFCVGVHAVGLARIAPGSRVGVFGAGAIGLSITMAAACSGAAEIVVTDRIGSRLEFAKKIGATAVVNADETGAAEWILKNFGELDVAIEAAGEAAAVRDAVQAVRPAGRVVVVGIPEGETFDFPVHHARRMEAEVVFARRSNHDLAAALRLYRSGKVPFLDRLATHEFPLERIGEAFETVDRRADGVIRAIVNI